MKGKTATHSSTLALSLWRVISHHSILTSRHTLSHYCLSCQGTCLQSEEDCSHEESLFLLSLIPRHHSRFATLSFLPSFFHTLFTNSTLPNKPHPLPKPAHSTLTRIPPSSSRTHPFFINPDTSAHSDAHHHLEPPPKLLMLVPRIHVAGAPTSSDFRARPFE